jgi:hypothetical protein
MCRRAPEKKGSKFSAESLIARPLGARGLLRTADACPHHGFRSPAMSGQP